MVYIPLRKVFNIFSTETDIVHKTQIVYAQIDHFNLCVCLEFENSVTVSQIFDKGIRSFELILVKSLDEGIGSFDFLKMGKFQQLCFGEDEHAIGGDFDDFRLVLLGDFNGVEVDQQYYVMIKLIQ